MPQKRTRPRAAPPQFVQSDYDTDTANVADAPPIQHLPAARTNEELNLAVLQRHNPEVQQILSIAPFAVVYLFSPDTQQWEKSGVEGTLFVCQLEPEEVYGSSSFVERYSVTVLNRKGLENFSTELLSANDVEITEQYVILQVMAEDGTPQIIGLWIFSEPPPSSTAQTREINAQIIQECASRAENSRVLAAQTSQGHDVLAEAEEQERIEHRDPVYEQVQHMPGNGHQQYQHFDQHFQQPQGYGGYHEDYNQYPQQASTMRQGGHAPSIGVQAQPDILLSLFKNARQGYNG